jgi:ribosomal protein S18 acetylase RimI-like enzyme
MNRAVHALAADLPQLTTSLVSAFLDDPVAVWMFDDPATRRAQLGRWMRFNVEMGLTRGHLYAAGGNMAAAVWSPPDVTLFDDLWGPRMAKIMGEQLGERAGDVMRALARVFASQPVDEPHFYLFTLGTHAEHQCRGLGGRVLAPVLERCDAQGLPAYLESSNPRNLGFYERHGFEVTGEIAVGDMGPVIRPMRREPGPDTRTHLIDRDRARGPNSVRDPGAKSQP